jgi:tRNA(adenine34) deaminase
MMDPLTDEAAMEYALAEARKAGEAGDVPVGAVVVHDGKVIAAGQNRRERDQDPTAHAEIRALIGAAKHLNRWRLHDCTLYVTLEPCFMCAGALVNARLDRVVFGTPDPKGGAVSSLANICADPRLNHRLSVTDGIAGEECGTLLRQFFAKRRRGSKDRDQKEAS